MKDKRFWTIVGPMAICGFILAQVFIYKIFGVIGIVTMWAIAFIGSVVATYFESKAQAKGRKK